MEAGLIRRRQLEAVNVRECSRAQTGRKAKTLAVAVGGTDLGRSGIGVHLRAILPGLVASFGRRGGQLCALGTAEELSAYARELTGATAVVVPEHYAAPAPNALWHLLRAGAEAQRAGAQVLLLPAANRRLTARSPIPTVGVVHDLAQLHVRGKYSPARMFYTRHVLLRALTTSTRLVAVSQATRADVVSATGRRDRVEVVYNGVRTEHFHLAAEAAARAAAHGTAGPKKPYVLYLARLEHPGKNHLRFLAAFAASRAAKTHTLVLAGADWGAERAIRAETQRLQIADLVRFAGYVDDAEVPGLLARADAVAMVGLFEGFGLPALEALAAGRPVIASRTGALPEVVGELGAMCDPFEVASMASAIDRSLEDEVLRERARAEGPAYASQWSWDTTIERLVAICDEALGDADEH